MNKKKLKQKLLKTVLGLTLCCSVVCAGSAFDIPRACLHFENARYDDEASVILWHWLLKQIRLSERNAALHRIYAQDCAAIFYDLDSDGEDEILGTHASTARNSGGEWLLYVLKKDKDNIYKEITGDTVYFDAAHPVCVMLNKTNGFRNIQVVTGTKDDDITYVFNKQSGLYYKKPIKQ